MQLFQYWLAYSIVGMRAVVELWETMLIPELAVWPCLQHSCSPHLGTVMTGGGGEEKASGFNQPSFGGGYSQTPGTRQPAPNQPT